MGSDANNFVGVWRQYLRLKVKINSTPATIEMEDEVEEKQECMVLGE